MSVIIDLNLACLVCLQQDENQLHSVFEHEEEQLPIAEKIACCSDLRLDPENSKLPDKICQHCLNDLDAAWRFRQNCATASSVFQSILQQDEQEEALANYELEQQNIKLPTGLKIKRVQAQTKTYLMPMQLEQDATTPAVEEDMEEMDQEKLDQQEDSMPTEQIRVILGEANEEENEEGAGEERVELEEYYETEQVLDDEDESDEQIESLESIERVEVKNESKESINNDVVESKVTEEVEDEEEEEPIRAHHMPIGIKIKEEMPEETEERFPKEISQRGRGRPKKQKTVQSHAALSENTDKKMLILSRGYPKFKSEPMDLKDSNSAESSVATKFKSKVNLGPKQMTSSTFKTVATRKRKFLSPDARPSKICEICGNSYKYQHALNAHMRRHTNTRPFACEFCEKAFVSNVELRRHMRVHTGHKPYACQYCERRFSDYGSRIKHERTHTGERPYICSCGKSFAYAHVLSVHMRTHTGEKKFQCTLCNKGFTKKAYLETHIEQHGRSANMHVAEHEDTQQPQQNLSRGELMAIKTVALEECIFTTEYIEQDDKEDVDRKLVEQYEITEILDADDNITEEHLEDATAEEAEYIIGVR